MLKLTERNYFSRRASREYMSVSQFKAFEQCPARAMAEIAGRYTREQTEALLVGSYVDAHFEGTLDAFVKQYAPEVFTRTGTKRAAFAQADEIIERVSRDRQFMRHMSGEKQVIMTGIIKGVPVKIKIDSLLPDRIVDLKIMKDFEPVKHPEKGLIPWFEAWEYDLQGAVYQEIVWQNTGKRLPFYLAAATKEKITDFDVIHIGQRFLDFAFERVDRDIEMYDAIKRRVIPADRCEKCEFCKKTKRIKQPTEAEEFYLI